MAAAVAGLLRRPIIGRLPVASCIDGAQRRCFSSSDVAAVQVRMLMVGSPGAGKGTLSTRLHQLYPSITTISAGDLLRRHIREETPLGKKAKAVVEKGGLMPDETMMDIFAVEVERKGDESWLLDGFPRTQEQARLLDAALAKKGKPLNLVVNLDVPEKVILSRILDRWMHPPSGRVYNLSYNPPLQPGKDDVTGEPLVQRSDDNELTFKSRLQSFHRETGPMIEHYSKTFEPSNETEKRPEETQGIYTSLEGSTSDEIWPKLESLMRWRFGE